MFIHYMYVDTLLPLKNAIPIMNVLPHITKLYNHG